MLLSVNYQHLLDFSALPTIRDICASSRLGLLIDDVPMFTADSLNELDGMRDGISLFKTDLDNLTSPEAAIAAPVMQVLHKLSHEVFKNLSHALELPWERYLGEMHEFNAQGQDELQILMQNESIPNRWSTLTILINVASPKQVAVLFGAALSVFSAGAIATARESTFDRTALSPNTVSGNWLVYYVRPNDGVYYTRTAGALMAPLSCEEYETRKRVREINLMV